MPIVCNTANFGMAQIPCKYRPSIADTDTDNFSLQMQLIKGKAVCHDF